MHYKQRPISRDTICIVSERHLNAKQAIFRLNNGENKLYFDDLSPLHKLTVRKRENFFYVA